MANYLPHSNLLGWNPYNNSKIINISNDNCSCPYDGTFPNGDISYNSGIGANPNVVFNNNRTWSMTLLSYWNLPVWKFMIAGTKNNVWSNNTIIGYFNMSPKVKHETLFKIDYLRILLSKEPHNIFIIWDCEIIFCIFFCNTDKCSIALLP